MATTTVRYERETVAKIGGADYLATREKKEIILEDHNDVQPSKKDESSEAGPVFVFVFVPVSLYDPPHGKPPAGRFKRKWKEAWKLASGPVKIFINGIAKALLDWFLS